MRAADRGAHPRKRRSDEPGRQARPDLANWWSEDNDTPEADACDGRELVVGSEGPMETCAEEKKQTTEPNEAPVNELVLSINDEPDRQQKTIFRLDLGAEAAEPKKFALTKPKIRPKELYSLR